MVDRRGQGGIGRLDQVGGRPAVSEATTQAAERAERGCPEPVGFSQHGSDRLGERPAIGQRPAPNHTFGHRFGCRGDPRGQRRQLAQDIGADAPHRRPEHLRTEGAHGGAGCALGPHEVCRPRALPPRLRDAGPAGPGRTGSPHVELGSRREGRGQLAVVDDEAGGQGQFGEPHRVGRLDVEVPGQRGQVSDAQRARAQHPRRAGGPEVAKLVEVAEQVAGARASDPVGHHWVDRGGVQLRGRLARLLVDAPTAQRQGHLPDQANMPNAARGAQSALNQPGRTVVSGSRWGDGTDGRTPSERVEDGSRSRGGSGEHPGKVGGAGR